MALQVLCVQICLGAVRTRKLAVGILDGDNIALGPSSSSGSSRSTGGTGQNTTTTLRSNNVGGMVTLSKHGVGLHQRAVTIRRRNSRLGHDATRWHRTKNRRSPTAVGSRSNGLRMRRSRRGLRHHGSRSPVTLIRGIGILSHWVHRGSRRGLRGILVAGQVRGRVWRVRRARCSRRVRMTAIERLHRRSGRLQRRQSLRKR